MEEIKLMKEAESYADAIEIRGCSYWNGLYRGYMAGKLQQQNQTETHDVSNVEEILNEEIQDLRLFMRGSSVAQWRWQEKIDLLEQIKLKIKNHVFNTDNAT